MQQHDFTPAEVAARLERARDITYWRGLAPGLHIGSSAPLPRGGGVDVDDEALSSAAAHMRAVKYCAMPALFSAADLADVNRAVDGVVAEGWPAVFAILFDETWRCCRSAALTGMLEQFFGGPFVQLPQFWIHLVPAVSGARGWKPHFDSLEPGRVSVWIALTEATLENGCMHLIPPDALPASFQTKEFMPAIPIDDVLRALQATRALPAPAGAALAWEHEVFHWGGRATDPRSPRRAMSLEFLGPGVEPTPDELPTLSTTGDLPSFDERIRFVAAALRLYGTFEPLARRFIALADGLRA